MTDLFLSVNAQSSLRSEDVAGFSETKLRNLARAQKEVTAGWENFNADVERLFGGWEHYKAVDRTFLFNEAAKRQIEGKVVLGRLHENALPRGQPVVYEKTGITVPSPDGTKTEFTYEAVPVPVASRPYTSNLLRIICALFHWSDGRLVRIPSAYEFERRFAGAHCALDVAELSRFESVVNQLLSAYPPFKVIVDKGRGTSVTGNEFLQHVYGMIKTCSFSEYCALHTMLALRVFKGWHCSWSSSGKLQKKKGPVMSVWPDGQKKRLIPEGRITALNSSDIPKLQEQIDAFKKATGSVPHFIAGSIVVVPTWMAKGEGNAKTAFQSFREANAIRGGMTSGINPMLNSLHLVPYESPSTLRVIQLLMLAVPLLRFEEAKVQIKVNQGDIMLLHTSLVAKFGRKKVLESVKYLVNADDVTKTAPLCRPLCIIAPDPDYDLVGYYVQKPPEIAENDNYEAKMNEASDVLVRALPKLHDDCTILILAEVYGQPAFESYDVWAYRRPWDFLCILTNNSDIIKGDELLKSANLISDIKKFYQLVIESTRWSCTYAFSGLIDQAPTERSKLIKPSPDIASVQYSEETGAWVEQQLEAPSATQLVWGDENYSAESGEESESEEEEEEGPERKTEGGGPPERVGVAVPEVVAPSPGEGAVIGQSVEGRDAAQAPSGAPVGPNSGRKVRRPKREKRQIETEKKSDEEEQAEDVDQATLEKFAGSLSF